MPKAKPDVQWTSDGANREAAQDHKKNDKSNRKTFQDSNKSNREAAQDQKKNDKPNRKTFQNVNKPKPRSGKEPKRKSTNHKSSLL